MQRRLNTVQKTLKTTQKRLKNMQRRPKTVQKRAHSGQQGSPWLPIGQDQSTPGPLPKSPAAQSMHSIHAAPAVVHCGRPPAPVLAGSCPSSWYQLHAVSYKEPLALLKSGAWAAYRLFQQVTMLRVLCTVGLFHCTICGRRTGNTLTS